MPGCSVNREVVGTTARFVLNGRFEGASAWELSTRLDQELLPEIVIDFSQVNEFMDYGIAVVSNAILALPQKQVHMRGLRQHQERLFRYFGVDPEQLATPAGVSPVPSALLGQKARASEVA